MKSKVRIFQNYRILILPVLLALMLGLAAPPIEAHQQPTTIILLDMAPDQVKMELQIPLSELELAFGQDADTDADHLIEKSGPELKNYLLAHVRPQTVDGRGWTTAVTEMQVAEAEQTQSGPYREINVHLLLTPPAGADTRQFVLDYDVIMHQVVSHIALVGLRRDWESGKTGDGQPFTLGYIRVDTVTTKIFPFEVNLEAGSHWAGFKGMLGLGMQHIREGTDHLLFLLVLLLPAPLLAGGRSWGAFGGTRYSLGRLLKIVTAFTLGHSVTLLVGALGWLRLPPAPVEILIAVSILVSAVHAVRPVFPGRETYVAAGFGLVHGLAFASVLADLDLGPGQMALSIFGFNLGIELIQLFVIAVTVPWLILLSQTSLYRWFRPLGAGFAAIAATAWIGERVTGTPNAVGSFVQNIAQNAHFGILILAMIALAAYGLQFLKGRPEPAID